MIFESNCVLFFIPMDGWHTRSVCRTENPRTVVRLHLLPPIRTPNGGSTLISYVNSTYICGGVAGGNAYPFLYILKYIETKEFSWWLLLLLGSKGLFFLPPFFHNYLARYPSWWRGQFAKLLDRWKSVRGFEPHLRRHIALLTEFIDGDS